MAYTKETGVKRKKADYGQLLRIAQQLENEAKANEAPPHSYGLGLSKNSPAQGVSAMVTDVWGEDNSQLPLGLDGPEGKIGTHPDLDEYFPGVSVWMTKAVQHYEKADKRCFICNEPSHFARDCPQWEEFHSQKINSSKGSGTKGTQAPLPKGNQLITKQCCSLHQPQCLMEMAGAWECDLSLSGGRRMPGSLGFQKSS